MNSKNIFLHFLLFFSGALLVSGFLLPRYYNLPYPAPLGPQFEPDIKKEHLREMEESQPDLVLIGDSVLYEGIDPILLTDQLGLESYAITAPGSGTAAWYLLIKNIVIESAYRPKYIVIPFRNTMLTVPQYRTTGRYFELLDDFAGKNEPLVAQLAFINQMNPLARFAEQYIPIYSARLELRNDLDNFVRYTPASVLGCSRDCTDEAVSSIFGREVDPMALNQMMEDAAKTLYAPEEMDFKGQVGTSFLPHMIQLAKKNQIDLIFVRTKIFGPEPLTLNQYAADLDAYLLENEHVHLLDYSKDPRILESDYVDSLHMNDFGQQKFTKILADDLSPIILQK
jgi:hypothetical protein